MISVWSVGLWKRMIVTPLQGGCMGAQSITSHPPVPEVHVICTGVSLDIGYGSLEWQGGGIPILRHARHTKPLGSSGVGLPHPGKLPGSWFVVYIACW